jgi:acyl-[acyl-carrier-protein]-phospholipid O-acyltransferase/long-chain-fatty-acid--[acyl-carrier-protein] ligase
MTALSVAAAAVVGYAAAAWLWPPLLTPLVRGLVRGLYRFRVYGADHLPDSGPALIVCNHVSYVDWLVLWAAAPRRVRFVLWAGYYRNPLLRFALSWARHRTVPIDNRTARPHAVADALAAVAAALDRGEAVVVFPEGRLTRNGQMLPFGRGIEHVLKRAAGEVPVIPTVVSGLWGSVWSHYRGRIGRKRPTTFRRPVSVWFGEPLPKRTPAPEVRAAVAEGMADLALRESDRMPPVPRRFVRTASAWRNAFRVGFVDAATDRKLSFAQGFVAAWMLADWLRAKLASGGRQPPVPASGPPPEEGTGGLRPPHATEPVGVWLPTGLGSALANVALAFLRRTAVNLNYTAGPDAVTSAARQVGMRYVVTARRFEARVPLELPPDVERLYLEDALGGLSKVTKALRFLAVLLLPAWALERRLGLHRVRPDDVLTIIFSSGSTGEPKGVMLTHRNIASNVWGFEVGVDITRDDVMLSTLPFFHSFGYTVNLWAPAVIGCRAVFHPDPRAAKEVGELCRTHRASIMMGTATFLRFYLRRCGPDDFKSLRLLICGAEKLPVPLIHEFRDRFGVQPLEGYGCTELSPVVCTSLPDADVAGVRQTANVLGTVGQPIPGVVAKAFDPDTLEPKPPGEDGLLGVKGPNVMLGYYAQPERTAKAIHRGWYLTGDMGRIEPTGFIRITGRLSRFAKIAGEMVPLERVEEELQSALGTADRLVTLAAVPDDRRGERLVVLYLPDAADRLDAALKELPKRGLPNLWVPDRRDCRQVEAFPVLGSGKLDLRGVSDLAKSMFTTETQRAPRREEPN